MPVLDAVLELPRTVLPLKSIRYQFVARGGLAEVLMTQVYCQENSQPLDCEYLFPLPADGAVYRCEAVINGRIIRARIEEREAARKLVEEKKAEGRRTALVESERENLFTLSLGNVQPQDVVEISLAYLQPLRRQGRQVSLDLPLCPGVRYIPGRELLRSNRGTGIVADTDQVPDASCITPPRIDGEHPDAAFIEVSGQVDAGFLVGDVTSPSHQLAITKQGDLLQLTLAKGGEVPDRDLSLRWQESEPTQAALRGWTSQSNDHHYAIIELRAPASVETTNAVPQDVYFLVDRSGSMEGEKWRKAIEALHGCVGVLNPSDRVWVTLFQSTFHDFDAEPATPADLLADRRFRKLASVGTEGGTEMGPALRHVLAKVKAFSQDRPAVVVLITDAEIGNDQEIVGLMREHPELPVHCFGIDTTLNDSLLLDLVRQQGGTFHALAPREDVAGRVAQLGRTLCQPVLVNLQVPKSWELAAGAMPNLYAGQIHLVSVRSQGALESNRLQVAARDHRNQPVTLDFQLTTVPEASPRLRWCKERLVNLAAKDDKFAAITLSRESNLLCPFTAFVAWDDQEKVAVASHHIVQPSLNPEYAAGMLARGSVCFSLATPQAARRLSRSEPQDRDMMFDCMSAPMCEMSNIAPLTQRIHQFISAIGNLPRGAELVTCLQNLLDWLNQSTDPGAVTTVAQLLDECGQHLEEWHRRQVLLHKLDPLLADELEHTAKMLHEAPRYQAGRPCFYDDVRSALSHVISRNTREELEATLFEMDHLEQTILERLKEFI